MRRTSVVLDPDLEISLKLEAMRQKRPSSELIREALREYIGVRRQPPLLPWMGVFESTAGSIAENAEDELSDLGEEEAPEGKGPYR